MQIYDISFLQKKIYEREITPDCDRFVEQVVNRWVTLESRCLVSLRDFIQSEYKARSILQEDDRTFVLYEKDPLDLCQENAHKRNVLIFPTERSDATSQRNGVDNENWKVVAEFFRAFGGMSEVVLHPNGFGFADEIEEIRIDISTQNRRYFDLFSMPTGDMVLIDALDGRVSWLDHTNGEFETLSADFESFIVRFIEIKRSTGKFDHWPYG